MTKKTESKKSAIARPPARKLSQGVEALLSPEPTAPIAPPREPARTTKKKAGRKQTARKPAPKAPPKEPRITFALRYSRSHMEKLEALYLQERASQRKLKKSDLVEEALDLLFAKYGI